MTGRIGKSVRPESDWGRALASRLVVEDEEWIESAHCRMIAGEAPHLETFFLSHKYGRPKDVAEPPDKPPIIFVSQFRQPGDYDPLARPAEPSVKPKSIAKRAGPGHRHLACSAPRGKGRQRPRRRRPRRER